MKWEYHVEQIQQLLTTEFVQGVLNFKGQEEWELVSSQIYFEQDPKSDNLLRTVPVMVLVFKRPVGD